ncbi:MAG: response regulator, partial [Holophagales bacterium]|nr:response regulator [Holophagales bacterium]
MSKILLVYAQARPAELLGRLLEARGAEVLLAPGGLYALTMLEREQPDLILTRADLGDMTGGDLCSMVKRDFSLGQTPVVLLTAGPGERSRAERDADFDLVLEEDAPPAVAPSGAPSQEAGLGREDAEMVVEGARV